MVFEDNEEFNVTLYNDDFEYLLASHSTKVTLLRQQKLAKQNQQGDYLGITTKDYEPIKTDIYISVFSDNNRKYQLEKMGLVKQGVQTYTCYATSDLLITEEDSIVYKGNEYVVRMNLQAEKSGQTSFLKFDIIAIQ